MGSGIILTYKRIIKIIFYSQIDLTILFYIILIYQEGKVILMILIYLELIGEIMI